MYFNGLGYRGFTACGGGNAVHLWPANPTDTPRPMLGRFAVFAIFAAVAKVAVASLDDGLVLSLFCRVPAWLAAAYYGAPCLGTTFHACGVSLDVTRACAATDFFSMLFGAAAAAMLEGCRRFRGALFLVLAYPATLLANAARLVALVPVDAFSKSGAVPASLPWFGEALHLLVGMLVFLPLFCLFWRLVFAVAKASAAVELPADVGHAGMRRRRRRRRRGRRRQPIQDNQKEQNENHD